MKKILGYCLLASTVVGFAACGNANKSESSSTDSTGSTTSASASTLNQLTNDPKGSPLHFYFNMNEVGQTDSSVVYDAKSLYNNDTVGFKLEVLKNIEAGITAQNTPDNDKGFRVGSLRISSLGLVSNNFLKAVGDLYGMQAGGPMTDKAISPMVFSSNNETVDLSKSKSYNFKLFFDQANGEPAEFFAVVDNYKKSFELTEKDSTFRTAFFNALTGK